MTLVYKVTFSCRKASSCAMCHVPCASHRAYLLLELCTEIRDSVKINRTVSSHLSLSKRVSCYVYVTWVNYTWICSIDSGTAAALEQKPISMPICPPQIPYGLNWNETRTSAVRDVWRHDSPSHSHQIESALTRQSFIHSRQAHFNNHMVTTNHLSWVTFLCT
jgi:hypothetical protein